MLNVQAKTIRLHWYSMAERHVVAQADLASGSDHPNTTIEQLPTEILYSIFDINADINEERPLETARHTSQVCSLWRNIMLTAPRTWGQIINLSELQVEKSVSPWRDLVMERAGEAPLFIKGEILTSRVPWFLNFLSAHWEKACHVDVQPIGRPNDYPPESLDFLVNPPRSIEAFHFPQIGFPLGAPWVANLRAISLCYPFRTGEILHVLRNIPRLEHARIQYWIPNLGSLPDNFSAIPCQSVILPHLTYLRLYHSLEEVGLLLQRIAPNRECEYSITTFYLHPDNPQVAQWDVLSRCLQRRIDLRSETTLDLSIHENSIDFKIVGDPTMPAFFHRHTVNRGLMQYQHDVSIILTRFNSHRSIFGRVTGLVFHAVDDDWLVDLNQYVNSFKVFFSLFPSVATLQLSQRSLWFLTEECEDENLFPSLETLEIQVYDKAFDSTSRLETVLPRFLNQRRMCGKAIKKLYVFPEAAKSDVSWSFLEELHDLTVVWIPDELSFA